MDPISFVFSVYLDTIQSRVQTQLTDTFGTEVKAVIIDYEGVKIPFQYQMWRVKDQRVFTYERSKYKPICGEACGFYF